MNKPENNALPPELHYQNAIKYKNSTRLNFIQSHITNLALDLILEDTDEPMIILDLGCGTGMSGHVISQRGHFWIGCDITKEMLLLADTRSGNTCIDNNQQSIQSEEFLNAANFDSDKRNNADYPNIDQKITYDDNTAYNLQIPHLNHIQTENFSITDINCDNLNQSNILVSDSYDSESHQEDIENEFTEISGPLGLLHLDIATYLPFSPGSIDSIVSISCIQWLFHNRSLFEARNALKTLFRNCKSILTHKGKAVFQFYNSKCKEHNQILLEESRHAGFFSEFVTIGAGRNLKTFLVLDSARRIKKNNKKPRKNKTVSNITLFKERRTKKGKTVSRDSRYSGRKRSKRLF